MGERTFTTEQVCRLTGLTPRQVGHWEKIGFIVPSAQPGRGRGSRRAYTFQDVVEFRVAKRLLDAGMSLPAVRRAVRTLQQVRRSSRPLSELALVSDGRSVYARYGDDWVDALRGGQLMLRIAVGEMADELRGEVAALPDIAEPAQRIA